VNNQQDGFPAAASARDLGLQLLHRLRNSLARMRDVYLSHGLTYKACVTSAGADLKLACWCPDPCFGVCCFDADMDYILPKNAASIKSRAVQSSRLPLTCFQLKLAWKVEETVHDVLRHDIGRAPGI